MSDPPPLTVYASIDDYLNSGDPVLACIICSAINYAHTFKPPMLQATPCNHAAHLYCLQNTLASNHKGPPTPCPSCQTAFFSPSPQTALPATPLSPGDGKILTEIFTREEPPPQIPGETLAPSDAARHPDTASETSQTPMTPSTPLLSTSLAATTIHSPQPKISFPEDIIGRLEGAAREIEWALDEARILEGGLRGEELRVDEPREEKMQGEERDGVVWEDKKNRRPSETEREKFLEELRVRKEGIVEGVKEGMEGMEERMLMMEERVEVMETCRRR